MRAPHRARTLCVAVQCGRCLHRAAVLPAAASRALAPAGGEYSVRYGEGVERFDERAVAHFVFRDVTLYARAPLQARVHARTHAHSCM